MTIESKRESTTAPFTVDMFFWIVMSSCTWRCTLQNKQYIYLVSPLSHGAHGEMPHRGGLCKVRTARAMHLLHLRRSKTKSITTKWINPVFTKNAGRLLSAVDSWSCFLKFGDQISESPFCKIRGKAVLPAWHCPVQIPGAPSSPFSSTALC